MEARPTSRTRRTSSGASPFGRSGSGLGSSEVFSAWGGSCAAPAAGGGGSPRSALERRVRCSGFAARLVRSGAGGGAGQGGRGWLVVAARAPAGPSARGWAGPSRADWPPPPLQAQALPPPAPPRREGLPKVVYPPHRRSRSGRGALLGAAFGQRKKASKSPQRTTAARAERMARGLRGRLPCGAAVEGVSAGGRAAGAPEGSGGGVSSSLAGVLLVGTGRWGGAPLPAVGGSPRSLRRGRRRARGLGPGTLRPRAAPPGPRQGAAPGCVRRSPHRQRD